MHGLPPAIRDTAEEVPISTITRATTHTSRSKDLKTIWPKIKLKTKAKIKEKRKGLYTPDPEMSTIMNRKTSTKVNRGMGKGCTRKSTNKSWNWKVECNSKNSKHWHSRKNYQLRVPNSKPFAHKKSKSACRVKMLTKRVWNLDKMGRIQDKIQNHWEGAGPKNNKKMGLSFRSGNWVDRTLFFFQASNKVYHFMYDHKIEISS